MLCPILQPPPQPTPLVRWSPIYKTSSSQTDMVTDARFEVLGSPYSLLSVSLSASQNLYTRRGTLVGVSGHAENVSSRWEC